MSEEPTRSRRYGVLIANSRFPEDPKLHELACPDNDVDGLLEVLNDDARGGFSDLSVLKNQPSYAVLRSIHRLLRNAGRDDLVLIYYAGHGKLDRAGRLHLATIDTVGSELETTSIPAQRIRDLIDNADTKKTAVILDCCYSGAIEKSFLRGDVDEQMNILAGGRGTFIMTASTDVQTAREEILSGYGVFTKHIIDGVRGAADVDGDGVVTMNELYRYVHQHVVADSHQVPMKWDLNVQGELAIAQTGRKPREERRKAVRERLFALADKGYIPDIVLFKALEISSLPFDQTRAGATARYDKLLDRLLAEEVRVGELINDWLQVSPDVAPESLATLDYRPQPRPEEPVASNERDRRVPSAVPITHWIWRLLAFLYQPTLKKLHRHPLYRLIHMTGIALSEQAPRPAERKPPGGRPADAKPLGSGPDVLVWIAWFVVGFSFTGLMVSAYEASSLNYFDSYSSLRSAAASGGMTGALIWAASGGLLLRIRGCRLNSVLRLLYWAGVILCLGLTVAFFGLGMRWWVFK